MTSTSTTEHPAGDGPAFSEQLGLAPKRDVLAVVAEWALAGHINDRGVTGEACAAIRAAAETEKDWLVIALREWAVSRWRAEVENRPLENKNRRALDDCWRQVMRYAGLDPDEAVGPSHDELLASRGA